ncbi:MAG: hypothetical protein JSW11_11720 [Candidatus Heimdallarchaeota archaeon]|nr:MAG: hypothetical protein JSW11_11720 [Candidatus Heimdallarchaeota archaeon]
MSAYYYLGRKSEKKQSQVISLGAFTGNTFYPTMAHEVFIVLVKEAKFTIHDEHGRELTIERFKDLINHTYINNPPLISLN